MTRPLLFIVGVPRSGTTLLRELLTQHPSISIPFEEMQLLPRLFREFEPDTSWQYRKNQNRLIEILEQSNFAGHMKRHGITLDQESFRRSLEQVVDWESLVQTLTRHYLDVSNRFAPSLYVGDKTPSNLMRVKQFSDNFPECRFIHIIRDPRDTVLSMRRAWSKSLYRAAVRWHDYIEFSFGLDADPKIASRVHTIRYEDLLASLEGTLRGVCDFLEIEFTDKMLSLRRGAEQWGDAAGSNVVNVENQNKFLSGLSSHEIKQIESICFQPMQKCGYHPVHANGHQSISRLRYHSLAAVDFAGGAMSHVRQKGVIRGIRYRVKQLLN